MTESIGPHTFSRVCGLLLRLETRDQGEPAPFSGAAAFPDGV